MAAVRFRQIVLAVALLVIAACPAFAVPLTPFRYEDQAQRHCPADIVVWLDLRRGVYYSRGQKPYGQGFDGGYVCRREARASRHRGSLLGLR